MAFTSTFPAVKACVDVLADEPGEVIARVVRGFYRELALVPREALKDGDIIEMLHHEPARPRMGQGLSC